MRIIYGFYIQIWCIWHRKADRAILSQDHTFLSSGGNNFTLTSPARFSIQNHLLPYYIILFQMAQYCLIFIITSQNVWRDYRQMCIFYPFFFYRPCSISHPLVWKFLNKLGKSSHNLYNESHCWVYIFPKAYRMQSAANCFGSWMFLSGWLLKLI